MTALTLAHVREAHARIRSHIARTPVITSNTLNSLTGAVLFFKCENFQKSGAFKARGAANAVFSLSDEEARSGVATHSSGNHAAALSRAAKLRGIPAHIVMPTNVARAKQASVIRYGGKITFCEPTIASREATAARVVEQTGAQLVHPYNDLRVMAGQGTAALELLEDVPDIDIVMAPVGGGGLISGTAVAAKALRAGIRVIAAEPAGADDASRSFKAGRILPNERIATIADGLRGQLGSHTFGTIREHVDDIVTVSDAAIIEAMRLTWEVMKVLIEPSAAVPLAALLEHRLSVTGQRVGIIVSGGNLDLDELPWTNPPVL